MLSWNWELVEARPLFDMLGDPRPGHGLLGVSDPDLHREGDVTSMLIGAMTRRLTVRIVQARTPPGVGVAEDRWEFVTDARGRAVELGAPSSRRAWDGAGMHTPCYVRGEAGGREVERIYYAGRRSLAGTGPNSRFAIGLLEKRDGAWTRRSGPVLTGDTARPSALEPYVVWADGRWRIWFLSAIGEVGRGEQPDYELRYSESDDGEEWEPPEVFASTEEGFFDNVVIREPDGWSMLLARGTNLHGTSPFPPQGLWVASATGTPGGRACWSEPERLLDTDLEAEPWYAAGVCGPAIVLDDEVPSDQTGGSAPERRVHVFATGTYPRIGWWRAAVGRLGQRRSLPPPAPFFLATGRFTFRCTPASGG